MDANMKLTHRTWGLLESSCDEPVLMAGPKPLLTELVIHLIMESIPELLKPSDQNKMKIMKYVSG